MLKSKINNDYWQGLLNSGEKSDSVNKHVNENNDKDEKISKRCNNEEYEKKRNRNSLIIKYIQMLNK